MVEYFGAVGAAGWLVPRPWESAQPCRVSGRSREKCSVRNLDGKKEREGGRDGEMHLTLSGFPFMTSAKLADISPL